MADAPHRDMRIRIRLEFRKGGGTCIKQKRGAIHFWGEQEHSQPLIIIQWHEKLLWRKYMPDGVTELKTKLYVRKRYGYIYRYGGYRKSHSLSIGLKPLLYYDQPILYCPISLSSSNNLYENHESFTHRRQSLSRSCQKSNLKLVTAITYSSNSVGIVLTPCILQLFTVF